MKNSILRFAAIVFVAGACVTGCATPAQKVEDAQNGIVKANNDLAKANEDYLSDMQTCKKIADERAEANDSSIAQFRVRIATEKSEAKKEYEMKIADLDRQNKDLKKQMDDYKADGKDSWDKFKTKFNDQVTAFELAFRNITEKKGQ